MAELSPNFMMIGLGRLNLAGDFVEVVPPQAVQVVVQKSVVTNVKVEKFKFSAHARVTHFTWMTSKGFLQPEPLFEPFSVRAGDWAEISSGDFKLDLVAIIAETPAMRRLKTIGRFFGVR